MRTHTVLAAALVGVLGAVPALAQEAVCLRHNRIVSTEILNNRTVVATDRQDNKYTIHMTAPCAGFDKLSAMWLSFRPWSELACLQHGDMIGYTLAGEPLVISVHGSTSQLSCTIGSVTAGAPAS